jgi:2,3-dihydroxybiphenyl 1,2-dioxygenase
MKHDIELGYIGVSASDCAAVNHYFGDVVGLMPGEPTPAGASTWRIDEHAQRIIVHEGSHDDAAYAGFVAVDAFAYDRAVARLRRHDIQFESIGDEDLKARRLARGVRLATPWQVPVELGLGLELAPTPYASANCPRGFVTSGQGLGHAVFFTDSADEYTASRRFVVDALGMTLSDTMDARIGPSRALAAFYHCNRRHHSIAIGYPQPAAHRRRLHHICIEAHSIDDVGFAFDRAVRHGTPIANALGRHPNDRMISFYSVSPGGWQLEIGSGGLTISDPWDRVVDYDRVSDWGHQPAALLGRLGERAGDA